MKTIIPLLACFSRWECFSLHSVSCWHYFLGYQFCLCEFFRNSVRLEEGNLMNGSDVVWTKDCGGGLQRKKWSVQVSRSCHPLYGLGNLRSLWKQNLPFPQHQKETHSDESFKAVETLLITKPSQFVQTGKTYIEFMLLQTNPIPCCVSIALHFAVDLHCYIAQVREQLTELE